MSQLQVQNDFINVAQKQGLKIQTLNGSVRSENLSSNHFSTGYVESNSIPMLNSKYRVVLDPTLKKKFNEIKLAVTGINYNGDKTELGFLMIAEEQPDGILYVSEIIMEKTGERHIEHDEKQIDGIVENMLNMPRKQGNKPFLIFGHTHPAQSFPNEFANSWSLGDFYSAFCASDRYKNDLQTAKLLITPSLDTNLLFYDRQVEKFYRFKEGIYEVSQDTSEIKINHAYTDPKAPPIKYDLKNLDF